jgi:uncharacterized protein
MNKNVIILAIVLILGIGAFLLWQRINPSATNQQTNSQRESTLESDHNLETATADKPGFIEDLRKREFKSGEIKIEETVSDNASYTSYLISYPSDNLTIYGRMNIPKGNGPFPVIILNHGYYNPSLFSSGDGTQTMSDILARNGYVTLASDYRGHGKSDSDGERGGHRPEYSIDVLNLLASVNSLEKADTERIGMWGHSMGGEVSLRTIEATDKVKAVALWAPTSANAADNHAFYGGRRSTPGNSTPELDGTSPINYLKYITATISIHQGLEDTEVRPEWSKELNDALKKEGKTVEYFEYPGQDHNFRNLGWDLISERTVAFYDKYLKR